MDKAHHSSEEIRQISPGATGLAPSGLQSILSASNRSERSKAGMLRALALASEHQCRVRVCQVLDPDVPKAKRMILLDQLSAYTTSIAEDARLDLSVSVRTYPDYLTDDELGRATALRSTAADFGADLIVLGAYRGRIQDRPWSGTMTSQLLKQPGPPILIVIAPKPVPYARILVAADFSSPSEQVVDAALDLVPDGEFFLLHALDERGVEPDALADLMMEQQDRLKNLLHACQDAAARRNPDAQPVFRSVIRKGKPSLVLRSCITEFEVDLVALGTRGKGGPFSGLLGSVAQDLIDAPPTDVLVLKSAK